MEEQLRFLVCEIHECRLNIERYKRIGVPQEMEESARSAYRQAIAKFKKIASTLGVTDEALSLAEYEKYIEAQYYLAELFPYLPTARLYKKFLDYGKRWHFAEKAPDKKNDFREEYGLLNSMTQGQLEEFLESNPDPDLAIHALGLIANQALQWSQSILLDFLLLADQVRKVEQKMISREAAAGMIQAAISKIENNLTEEK